ncbi:hypothetical protein A2U01_0066288, partial [Trifolium medium]|nr:hypothetical protein [Trifolium medium]
HQSSTSTGSIIIVWNTEGDELDPSSIFLKIVLTDLSTDDLLKVASWVWMGLLSSCILS